GFLFFVCGFSFCSSQCKLQLSFLKPAAHLSLQLFAQTLHVCQLTTRLFHIRLHLLLLPLVCFTTFHHSQRKLKFQFIESLFPVFHNFRINVRTPCHPPTNPELRVSLDF